MEFIAYSSNCPNASRMASLASFAALISISTHCIDRGHISDLERGKKSVCLPMLEVLSNGFGISISELMRGL
jgi:transcriptional regulator with XRE-family HTH domain